MTATATDPRLSVLAIGPLADFAAAGVLAVADVQTAMALRRIAVEAAGVKPSRQAESDVTLAAALAVRALREGSVGLDLTTVQHSLITSGDEAVDTSELPWPQPAAWLDSCREHPLVAVGDAAPADRPLRLGDDGLLYLQKYWQQQELIAANIAARAQQDAAADLDDLAERLRRLFPDPTAERPRLAAAVAATGRLLILAGGPGTGKTTTIARVLALLRELHGPQLQAALAAPTGKAAARMAEATNAAIAELYRDRPDRRFGVTASTLHLLLGWRPDARNRFAHDRTRPLPHDVVVVDETSMVSVTLMARLLEAVRPEATLILVGDPDQLASIEAGAVLADIVRVAAAPAGPRAQHVRVAAGVADAGAGPAGTGAVTLTHNFRFGGGIADVAHAIRRGEPDDTLAALRSSPEITFAELEPGQPPDRAEVVAKLRAKLLPTAAALHDAALRGDATAALELLNRHRLLCAHRAGPYGVAHWNALVRSWIDEHLGLPPTADGWSVGRTLIVTSNDRALGLFNGDTGVVIAGPDGAPLAAFDRGEGPLLIPPIRLDHVVSLEAMTIHRGQGSQFTAVTVVLPPPESPLLTRELLYTAVTRAQERVRIIGTAAAVTSAVTHHVRRASGLQHSIERHLAGTGA